MVDLTRAVGMDYSTILGGRTTDNFQLNQNNFETLALQYALLCHHTTIDNRGENLDLMRSLLHEILTYDGGDLQGNDGKYDQYMDLYIQAKLDISDIVIKDVISPKFGYINLQKVITCCKNLLQSNLLITNRG